MLVSCSQAGNFSGIAALDSPTSFALAQISCLCCKFHGASGEVTSAANEVPTNVELRRQRSFSQLGVQFQKQVGETNTDPRWAVAWKPAPEEAVTVLQDVILTVGRTGDVCGSNNYAMWFASQEMIPLFDHAIQFSSAENVVAQQTWLRLQA
jgi:hypothetical protein